MNGETDEIDSSFQNGVLVFYEIVHGVLWFEENHRWSAYKKVKGA